ncbi:hypothetical protein Q5O24_14615 [Eubacteriaceae bacterium ES3]|nr:hypothetical protein Q5O24_14615 [Eubacteriaceae bacterium ES3]
MGNQSANAIIWPYTLCFLAFGIMTGLDVSPFSILHLIGAVLVSVLIGGGLIVLLLVLFRQFNYSLTEKYGNNFSRQAVSKGIVFMIPFTVLALLAFFLLGWNAIMPFAATAITTSAANSGTEIIKLGGKGMKNVLIPTFLGLVFSTSWMMLLALIP